MKVFIAFSFLFFTCVNLNAQENLFYKGSQINYYKADSEFVAIMNRPVTNREYIIYLQWMRSVFGPTYPDLVYKCFPTFNMDTLNAIYKRTNYFREDLNSIFQCTENIIKDYMFNPKYLDYPVVGVSWQNANNYGKWLADRYNEDKMIKKDFLFFSYTPTDQDFFSTDTYIAGLWQGLVKRYIATHDKRNPERRLEWGDNVFIPAFRLATQEEIKLTSTNISEFKPYPFSKKHFLQRWHKEYFASESDTLLELWLSKRQIPTPEKISCNKTNKLQITDELLLDINNNTNEKELVNLYKQNQQYTVNIKTEIESMQNRYTYNYTYNSENNTYISAESAFPYLIIGEGKDKNPIYVTNYKDIQPASIKEFKTFRLACSATPEQLGIKIK